MLGGASNIGGIKVEIGAETTGFDHALNLSQQRLKSWAKNAKIAAAIGAGAFALAAKKVISATIEQEKAIASLESALKATGNQTGYTSKQLQDMASAFQSLTTYGDEPIIQMQALLATFKAIGGDTFKRAQENILDLATAMGMDLTSATRMVGRALNDPVQGMTALSRVGIILSEDQKSLIKNLMDTGRAAEAQGVILKELEGRFGGAAAAAKNTLGGAIEGLKNAFGDLFESSDSGALTDSINDLAELMQSQGMKDGFQAAAQGILAIVSASAQAVALLGQIGIGLGIIAGYRPSDDLIGRENDLTSQLNELVRQREEVLQRHSERIADQARTIQSGIGSAFAFDQVADTSYLDEKIKEIRSELESVNKELWGGGTDEKEGGAGTLVDSIVPENANTVLTERLSQLAETRAAFDEQVAAMREGFVGSVPGIGSPEEYEEGRALLQEHYDNVLTMEQEYAEQMRQQRMADSAAIIQAEVDKYKMQQAAYQGFWSDMVGLAQSGGGRMAEIGKKFAIAQAVVKGYQAAVDAWQAGMSTGGPYAPAVAAAYTAASLAKTAGLIGQIKSGGTTTTASNGTAAVNTAQAEPARIVSVNFQGGDYERMIGGRLIEMFNDEVRRGGRITGVQMS